jgi:hypothetical protein
VKNDFKDLIKYFESESSNFHVLFVSSFGLYEGVRLGIKDLFKTILP